MSWWVMEQVSVNEAGTQTLANIQCDNVSDLPAPDQSTTLGYIIVRGSQAKVLATSENYILGSTGTWVKMEDGIKLDLTGYATEQYVDDGLADKVDTSVYSSGQAAQDAEINYAINTGTRNLLNNQYLSIASGTGVTITDNGDGTYNLSGTPTGTATYLYTPSGSFSSLYGLKIGTSYTITTGSNKVLIRVDYSTNGTSWDSTPLVSNVAGQATFTIPPLTTGLYIRFRSVASAGSLDGTVLKPMIRDAVIRNSTFEPYAPTNRELYEMILALQ